MSNVQYVEALDDLMALVIEFLVKKADADLTISVPFIEVFMEACIYQKVTKNVFVQANPGIRYQIREYLIKNNYIVDNSKDVEAVFITQKAIDKVLLLVEAKAYVG